MNGVTLNIRQGTATVLVGLSGSGKSTITGLTISYWDADGRSITISGVDVKSLLLGQVMGLIGYVSQDNLLLNVSVRESIHMERPGAANDGMAAVTRVPNCHDSIMNLDYGCDTMVGDAGGHLSDGEHQRATIV